MPIPLMVKVHNDDSLEFSKPTFTLEEIEQLITDYEQHIITKEKAHINKIDFFLSCKGVKTDLLKFELRAENLTIYLKGNDWYKVEIRFYTDYIPTSNRKGLPTKSFKKIGIANGLGGTTEDRQTLFLKAIQGIIALDLMNGDESIFYKMCINSFTELHREEKILGKLFAEENKLKAK